LPRPGLGRVDRLIKVGRTIADLAGKDRIDAGCLHEAAAYRALDHEPTEDPRLEPAA
jgi:predicted ATPase with chaperone activity